MNKLSKILVSVSLLATLFVGCSTKKESSPQVDDDIKVESISFTLENDNGYVDNYIQMHDLEVLPYDASNKTLEWSIEQPDLAEVIKDRIYLYQAGDTNVICKATDGSGIEVKKPIHIMDHVAPSGMEIEEKQFAYLGEEMSPVVTFYPDSRMVDQRFEIIIPEEYQDILEVGENGDTYLPKKVGAAKIVVASKGNKELKKEMDVIVEDDAFSIMTTDITSGEATYYADFDGRHSVWKASFALTDEDSWPSITLALKTPINLSRQNISIDAKCVSGHPWYDTHFLNENRDIVYREGHDIAKGTWETSVYPPNGDLIEDIYFVRFFLNTGRAHAASGEGNATIYFDNFKILATPLESIAYRSQELIIDCENEYTFKDHDLLFTPSNTTERAIKISVKPGYEEYISVIGDKTIKGLTWGEAYLILSSKTNSDINCEVKVSIVLENVHPNALHLYRGDSFQENLPTIFSLADNQDKIFCFAFKPIGDGTFGFTIGDHYNKWKSIAANYSITIINGFPYTKNGVIVPDNDGWFIWKHLVSAFDGDGIRDATDITSIESNYDHALEALDGIHLDELYIDIQGAYLEQKYA